ncbi:hypothetical protein [Kordia jejudonensis]|uniref:hypothetical protein n=1 Tax=Kordia jejudonensis TaxID=1348245 RepID=UPI00062939C3|nr:hypothetical protein [Kordia jejudonensis]
MKRLLCILFLFLLESCSSVKLASDWKNPDIDLYVPSKVFIVGLTTHDEARMLFEKQLQEALTERNLEAFKSINFLTSDFSTKKQSKQQLDAVEKKLLEDGFDTILFSKIIRVEEKVTYKKSQYNGGEASQNFKEDFITSQNFLFNTDYYKEYKIYHLEATLYCICPTKERELLWKGYIEVSDKKAIDKTIDRYVKLILLKLENQQLIPSKTSK